MILEICTAFGENIQKVVANFHIIVLDAISRYGLCLVWLRLCCDLFTVQEQYR